MTYLTVKEVAQRLSLTQSGARKLLERSGLKLLMIPGPTGKRCSLRVTEEDLLKLEKSWEVNGGGNASLP